MSLQLAAQHLAQHGRGDDKMLVHMTPKEVSGLQQLAQMHGGSLTRNPHTGLPEAGFLDSLMPTIIGAAAMYFTGGAAAPWIEGLSNAAVIGGGVGLAETARTGSLSKGLMAGLGAYGGAGLAGGMMAGAGQQLAGESLAAEAANNPEALGKPLSVADYARTASPQDIAAASKNVSGFDLAKAGFRNLTNEGGFSNLVNNMGGGMNLAKTGLAAASPVIADQMVQTTTAPPASRSAIHPFMYDPGGGYIRLNSISPAENFKGFASGGIADDNSQSMFNYAHMQPAVDLHSGVETTPQGMANGGVAHFAGNDGSVVSDATAGYAPGMSAQDVVNQYHLDAAQAAQVANNLGYTGDLSGLNYGAPAAAAAFANMTGGGPANPSTAPAAPAAPAYTTYADPAITNYIQTSGIDLSNPDAVNSALAQAHMDPAAYAAYMKSGANPYSVSALSNPTATNVTNFDKSLGANPSAGALTDIRNAVVTAQDTSGGPNTATNMPANTQIAKEMDLWNVDPTTMGKAVNMTADQIQAIYNQVNPNGKYSTVKTATHVTPGVTPGGTQLPNATTYDNGAYGNYGSGNQTGTAASGNVVSTATPGDIITNPDKSVSVVPNIPGRTYGGFTGMGAVTDAFTAGGGHTGPTNLYVPKSVEELNAKHPVSGGSQQMLDYLSGKTTENPILQPYTPTGQISKDYASSVAGYPAQDSSQKMYTFDAATKKYIRNPDFIPHNFDPVTGNIVYGKSLNQIRTDFSKNASMSDADWLKYITDNNIQPQQIADATNVSLGEVLQHIQTAKASASNSGVGNTVITPSDGSGGGGEANGGIMHAAMGGAMYSSGGIGDLGSYSDGGRLLRGPGDGVSDSIPATIGQGKPARLADGEFVVPARIVSELGNGSTEAGARKLYAMMDRVQNTRGKTIGKGKVATNTRADKFLPA